MKLVPLLTLPAMFVLLISQSTLAIADPLFGSTALLTARDCSNVASTTDCIGGAAPRVFTSLLGGPTTSLDATLTNAHGIWSVKTGANPGGLPVLKAGSWSGASSRLNTNAVVYQQFTFTGPSHTLFSLVGNLNFDSSGNNGLNSAGQSGQGNQGEQAGEASVFATMYFMDPAAFATVHTANDVLNLLSQDCLNASVYAYSDYDNSAPLAAGQQNAQLKLNKNCSGSDMYLNPGDTAVLVLAMQTESNRGGFSDATHSFVTAFDPALPAETLRVLEQNFIPAAPSDIPEPSALALVTIGLAGLILSRKRYGAVWKAKFSAKERIPC